MTVPSAVVKEAFMQMESRGELKKGDNLPRPGKMFPALGLKRVAYNMAMWELVLAGEVSRIDQRHFWGAPPSNTRSKEQVHLILINAVAEGILEEGEVFPTSETTATAFNIPTDSVDEVSRILTEQQIISSSRPRKRVVIGAQARAKQAVEAFEFTFTALDSSIDELFESLEQQADAEENLRLWRHSLQTRCEWLFLSSLILCRFGVAHATGVTAIELRSLSSATFQQRIGECRNWLRRYHQVDQSDHLLLAIASL